MARDYKVLRARKFDKTELDKKNHQKASNLCATHFIGCLSLVLQVQKSIPFSIFEKLIKVIAKLDSFSVSKYKFIGSAVHTAGNVFIASLNVDHN